MSSQSAGLRRVSPLTALFLSAFLLPGLGQILTGRLAKGIIMAAAVALWLPLALIKLFRDLGQVMPELLARKAEAGALAFADFQAALHPMADSLAWLFSPLVLIWFWSFTDSLFYLAAVRKVSNHASSDL